MIKIILKSDKKEPIIKVTNHEKGNKEMIIDTTHHTFHKTEVEALAESLNTDPCNDDGWKYVVKYDPKGGDRAIIEVYDEDGEFVSLF